MKFFIKSLPFIAMLLLCACASYKPPSPAPLVSFSPTLNVQSAWSRNISHGTSGEYLKLTPVIVNGKMFVADYGGGITEVDASTGRKIWKINTNTHLTSGIAANDGMIFVADNEGQLLAFRQDNGAFAWWAPMSSQVLTTPTVTGNILLVKAENGELSAFNIDNGKLLWTYSHEEPTLILRGGSSPQVFNNYVIAGFASGQLVVIDLHDGQFIWREPIAEGQGSMAVQRMVDIDVNPKIIGGVIYVATYQGKIAAVTLKTGRVLWQHKLSSYSGLAVDTNQVYVSDDQGNVWAFDRKTGNVIWKQRALTNRKITGPVIIGNAVVVGDGEGYLHFMSQTDGHFLARIAVRKNDAIITKPTVIGNNVFVYTKGGYLAKFVVKRSSLLIG